MRRLRRDLRELYNVDTEIVVVQGGSLHRGNRYVLRVLERGKDLARLAGLVDARGRPVRGMPVSVVQGGRQGAPLRLLVRVFPVPVGHPQPTPRLDLEDGLAARHRHGLSEAQG